MFLSVFMVFKLSISIINYVINPDALSDKSKGFGKLITNVVISLILLAITPNLFNMAFNLQTDILNSNAIYQIITGKKLSLKDNQNTLYENARVSAEQIAFGVHSGFVYRVEGEDSDDPSKTGDAFGAYCEEKDVANGCGKTVNGEFVEHVCGNTTCLLDGDTVTNSNNNNIYRINININKSLYKTNFFLLIITSITLIVIITIMNNNNMGHISFSTTLTSLGII